MKYTLMAILFLFGLLIMLPLKLEIDYTYTNNCNKLDISTSYLFGLFKLEVNPFNKNDNDINHKDKISKFKDKKLLSYIWDKLIFKELIWNTKIGFNDAALVAIIYGMLWNVKVTILNLVLINKEIKSIDIHILPEFNSDRLDIKLNCIFEIKIAHIIVIWFLLFKIYKGGDGINGASNRRINENYNE